MGAANYICANCSQSFTRMTSAKRHNFTQHHDNGEIVPILQYMAGITSGRYRPPMDPSVYRHRRQRAGNSQKRIPNFGHTTTGAAPVMVADSMGDFRPGSMQTQGQHQPNYPQQQQQQYRAPTPQNNSMSQYLDLRERMLQSQSQSQSQPQPIPSPTRPQPQPIPPLQSQPTEKKNSFGLSNETIFRLAELKARLYAHSDIFPNFDEVYQAAKSFAISGDESFLLEKLQFLRTMDAFGGNLNQFQLQPQPQSGQSNVVV
jgi:hypothetical protein